MAIAENQELQGYCEDVAKKAKQAAALLNLATGQQKNDWLRRSAQAIREQTEQILKANAEDVKAAPGFGLTDAQTDRLRLDPERINAIATGMEEVAMLPDPVGEVIESTIRPNGLRISRVRVPLGVVFFIYESRPNVTADAASICVKSGNSVILRGGKEAAHSSLAVVDIIRKQAADCQLPRDAVQLVATLDRQAVGHFLRLSQYIDLAIPRGGEGLIRRVSAEAAMPVIKHFHGNCHVYIDRAADLEMAEEIAVNSKCQRMGVCNAAESILLHREIAEEALPKLAAELAKYDVEIRGDEATCSRVPSAKKASDEDYSTEFLGPIVSIKVVDSVAEAIEHINRFGSGHTDAIVTNDLKAAGQFTNQVDSAAVIVNASTRFNDGSEFGLGAEIGISTDRFHARGPCGLRELTSYKYLVEGQGQIR
ncbi:MAG: glutamate-5-semialdehyde dehydrogenase [Planctomycetaceae bacterium]|nr:glutamate-5-semialdehyde dehydrogenase [Planctomycetaceae bacterium]